MVEEAGWIQDLLEEDERYFLSFGATGEEDLHIFSKDNVSAMDAISIMGGINDRTAASSGSRSRTSACKRSTRSESTIISVN